MINEWRRGQAKQRGGGQILLSLDAASAETRFAAEPTSDADPDKLYDRTWAWTLLDRVLARLRADQEREGKGVLFDKLKSVLMGERLESPYRELAAKLGVTEDALRMAVHRLRRRFREMLRAEIAPTVEDPAEIDAELRHLLGALADN